MSTFFVFWHHLAALTVMVCALISLVQLRQPLDLNRARLLRGTDMVNGIAATLVLAVGLVRVFYFEKGAAYYFHSAPFIAKLTLYGLASLLSLVPTLEILRWRVPLKLGLLPSVSTPQLARMRRVAHWQLACVLAMALCATLAARGIGVIEWPDFRF